MAVNLQAPTSLLPVPGIRVGSACAEIKQDKHNDLALFEFVEGTQVAGVYTQSHFAAAPVQLARERQLSSRCWVVNSGNANAATGEPGLADAGTICAKASRLLQIPDLEVQPFSTGVIGERLPVEKMTNALVTCHRNLSAEGWLDAAHAIMTTDTVAKGKSISTNLAGTDITVTGIAKGSGMIKPNMATMLSYIGCDAKVTQEVAQSLVTDSVEHTFNRVTVDGDTSTNDCYMLACSGVAEHELIDSTRHPLYVPLLEAITEVARFLAQALARDGEGATKFITVKIQGAKTKEDALAVAYTIAESPLVKTAMFAGDANWGRFCMAIGRAPTPNVDATKVALWLDDVQVAEGGLMSSSYQDEQGAQVLAQDEFSVTVDLGLGEFSETVWTSDLSYEYIRINAEYRT